MEIQIIFGTNSSGTHEAAIIIEQVFTAAGHTVTKQHARDTNAKLVGQADLTILGSCTWERFVDGQRIQGQLQPHMHGLAEQLQTRRLPEKKFAVYALGDSSYTNFAQAGDKLEALVKTMGATQLGPTLKIDGWFFNLEQNRKRVADWARRLV